MRHRDLGSVQEYMLAEVVTALNAEQDTPGWERHLDRFRMHSGSRWENVDALLFDYTMARLIAICPGGPPPLGSSVAGSDDVFIRAFTDAVVDNDVALATYIWADINFGWRERPGMLLPSMIALLTRLRAFWHPVMLDEIRARLAPEFAELV